MQSGRHSRHQRGSFAEGPVGLVIAGAFVLAAALAGSYLGGKLSRDATRDAQREQFAHEETSQLRVARGIARVMIADFDGATRTLCDIGERGSWFVAFVPLRSRVTTGDRRIVASQLDDHRWRAVSVADVRLGTWDAVQRGVTGKPVDPLAWGFPRLLARLQRARRALEPLAGYPSGIADRTRERCPQTMEWRRSRFACVVPSGAAPRSGRLLSCAEQPRHQRRQRWAGTPPSAG